MVNQLKTNTLRQKMEQDNSIAARLKEALINHGLNSHIAILGVKAGPLAKHLGVSVQTIRKYLTGQAAPSWKNIINMAEFLNVCPGWLAFGTAKHYTNQKTFEVKKIFIQEIFQGLCNNLLHIKLDQEVSERVSIFLHGIINDIVQLEASDEIKLRLIKTSISSASIMENLSWKTPALIK